MPVALPLSDRLSQSSSRTRTYKSKKIEFGNGYSQTIKDGINAIRDEYAVTYNGLTKSELNSVTAALDAVGSWDYLTWQPPEDSTPKRWKVTDEGWTTSSNGPIWTISFTLKQVF